MTAILLASVANWSDVDLSTHPRPDWARPCEILDGPWKFDFDPENVGLDQRWFENHAFGKTIQVPFPWQSELSGVQDTEYQGAAWYQREVTAPTEAAGKRLFLVFGAVDWHAKVWVNGRQVAEHEGGYTPFSAEMTDLVAPGETATVTVRAWDVTDPETPTGKQTGWYTRTGGIWQSVYLELRGPSFLTRAHVSPDVDRKRAFVDCAVEAKTAGTYRIRVEATQGDQRLSAEQAVSCRQGQNDFQLTLPVPDPALWSPDSPTLYDATIELRKGGEVLDTVRTYFGMRKVSTGVYGGSGHEYILLNDKPVYLRGALHQSFNPKGIYSYPDDDFRRTEYATAKELGLNFIRIHIKVEEPRALYWADKLGVLLMCDIPCYSKHTDRARRLWEETLRATIERDFNHPAIFAWCDFNETWGIGDGGYGRPTQEWVRDMYLLTKQLDPTRLAEDNSPCLYDHTLTDINSWHFYIDRFEPAARHVAEVVEKTFPGSTFNYAEGWAQGTAPLINSEYGGVGAGSGDRDVSWVFLFLTNLLRKYDKIGGYVYTELSDIEWEHNGFLNYDRSPKEFNYPAGITVRDLQDADFPVLDCPPYQQVKPGDSVNIPILFSHWSERENLKLRISTDGNTVDGRPWSQFVAPIERDLTGAPYRTTSQEPFNLTIPDAAGLMNVVVEILFDGQRCAANYCVLDIRGGTAWNDPNLLALSFPVKDYAKAGPDMPALTSREPLNKVWGHGAFGLEYRMTLPSGLKPRDIQGCRLVAEIGARAEDERLDWPARKKAEDYPQTDEPAWPTDVTVSLNGIPIETVTIANDFADARGVLSHAAHFHHGSCGAVVDIPITGKAYDALLKALKFTNRISVEFAVAKGAAHAGGLALYGHNMGQWPSDPTLVFTLAPNVEKPQGNIAMRNVCQPKTTVLLPTGPGGHTWKHTFEAPPESWNQPDFDDRAWAKGANGFGAEGTPGARIGTPWTTSDIWLRTQFKAPSKRRVREWIMELHHDEDVEIYVNGSLLLRRNGYVGEYERIDIDRIQARLFNYGATNTIAVHCHQTGGGQFIDLGLSATQ